MEVSPIGLITVRRAVAKIAERFYKLLKALFLPGAKDEKKPPQTKGLSCFRDTPIGKAPGCGYWWGSGGLSRNMTIPRQRSLGEVIGQKKGKAQPKPRPVSPGRPRREVDVELLRALRAKGYGYKSIAREYTKGTGEYISHTTMRERLVDG